MKGIGCMILLKCPLFFPRWSARFLCRLKISYINSEQNRSFSSVSRTYWNFDYRTAVTTEEVGVFLGASGKSQLLDNAIRLLLYAASMPLAHTLNSSSRISPLSFNCIFSRSHSQSLSDTRSPAILLDWLCVRPPSRTVCFLRLLLSVQ